MIGVKCREKGNLSFEECFECAKCLPRPLLENLQIFPHTKEFGKYGVKEIIGCLRKAYYQRTSPLFDSYYPLQRLLAMKRGQFFEDILESSGWNKLRGTFEIEVEDDTIEVRAEADCFDVINKCLIELKTTELEKRKRLPFSSDVLQIQCYWTIFSQFIREIRELKIVYLDMSDFRVVSVEKVDMTSWIQERASELYIALRDGGLPRNPITWECKRCFHSLKCRSSSTPSAQKMGDEVAQTVKVGE